MDQNLPFGDTDICLQEYTTAWDRTMLDVKFLALLETYQELLLQLDQVEKET